MNLAKRNELVDIEVGSEETSRIAEIDLYRADSGVLRYGSLRQGAEYREFGPIVARKQRYAALIDPDIEEDLIDSVYLVCRNKRPK